MLCIFLLYATVNGVLICVIRWTAKTYSKIWLLPFFMLILNFIFNILLHENSGLLSGFETQMFRTYLSDTLISSLVVVWSAILGAVFLSDLSTKKNESTYNVKITENSKEL